jgi:hypothetical protein
MPRFDLRPLILVPLLLTAAACGDDAEPVAPPAPTPSVSPAAPSALPSPAASVPEPSDSVYVEEDEEPTPEQGELPGEAQSYLDEALGIELGSLEGAPPATASKKRATLDKLPDNPRQVLTALRDYEWFSPEAKQAYDRAVEASR